MPPMKPGSGEQRLPGFRDMSSRNAFARAATPEYMGLDPVDYDDIDERMIELADPERLRSSLIFTPSSRINHFDFGVTYVPDEERIPVRIALTPDEYSLIPRDVGSLSRAVVSRTLKLRVDKVDFMASNDAASRSGVHALEAKEKAMTDYIEGTLSPDINKVRWLREAVSHPGYWRAREGDMRTTLRWVHDHLFKDIFVAIRHQRGWTPAQEDLARRAVNWRLYFDRNHNHHLKNWDDMLKLDLSYLGHKKGLFLDRVIAVQRTIEQIQESSKRQN